MQPVCLCLWSHFAHSRLSESHSISVHSLSSVLTAGCGSHRVSLPARVWMFECGGKQRWFSVYLFSKARREVGPLSTGNPPTFFSPPSISLSLSLSQLIRSKTRGKGRDKRAKGVTKAIREKSWAKCISRYTPPIPRRLIFNTHTHTLLKANFESTAAHFLPFVILLIRHNGALS